MLNFFLQTELPVQSVDTLTSLARLSPIIGLLVAIVIYLAWKLERKEKAIEDLNAYIRENDKNNLSVLSALEKTLDNVIDSQKNSSDSVTKDITSLKDYIRDKNNNH